MKRNLAEKSELLKRNLIDRSDPLKKNFKGNLPNVLTLINLSLGVLAILLAVSDSPETSLIIPASLIVMLAALTDRFDGKVARMLDATSELGKELDSLSDLISFGLAPIIIAWKICFIPFGIGGYLLAIVFPIAGAYRLARFNVSTFTNVYMGMPITIAGAFLTILNIYNSFAVLNEKFTNLHRIIAAFVVVALSYLMVSTIKIKKR